MYVCRTLYMCTTHMQSLHFSEIYGGTAFANL